VPAAELDRHCRVGEVVALLRDERGNQRALPAPGRATDEDGAPVARDTTDVEDEIGVGGNHRAPVHLGHEPDEHARTVSAADEDLVSPAEPESVTVTADAVPAVGRLARYCERGEGLFQEGRECTFTATDGEDVAERVEGPGAGGRCGIVVPLPR
jgi:hypothetical protein